MNGDWNVFAKAPGEIIALQQTGDGVLSTKPDHLVEAQGIKPLAVEADFRLARIEDLKDLRLVGFGIAQHFLTRHRRAGDVTATRIPDQARHVADQEDHLMAQILEMLEFANQDRVPEVQIRRSRIEAGLHSERTPFGQTRLELLLRYDF